jgi:S-adenosylmethionine hydrolase
VTAVPQRRPFVSLTTDFGMAYTSICAGVIASIAPDANVLVLSDEVTKYSIREGALLLRQALPYLPVGVHAGIVDPGVGTPRQPVAIETGRGDVLVGPDNGLLIPAAEALGGVVRAHLLEDPAYRLPTPSTTFHGRDIFSPAAAHAALGVDLSQFGGATGLLPFDMPRPAVAEGTLTAPVLYVDEFGSLILAAERSDLTAALGDVGFGTALHVGFSGHGTVELPFAETFGAVPVGDPLLWVDSSGWLGVAVNQGSAARRFGMDASGTVTVRPA